MKNRPNIIMNISVWENILLGVHLLLFATIVGYYFRESNNIPEWIPNSMMPDAHHKGGGVRKVEYIIFNVLCHFSLACAAIYNILLQSRSKYFGGRSVSNEISKALRQYRVEASWFLCLTAAIRLLLVTGNIVYVETYLKKSYISIHWWPQFFITVGFIWLIHHILWTRLANE
jgi:hypothetical protein